MKKRPSQNQLSFLGTASMTLLKHMFTASVRPGSNTIRDPFRKHLPLLPQCALLLGVYVGGSTTLFFSTVRRHEVSVKRLTYPVAALSLFSSNITLAIHVGALSSWAETISNC